MTSLPHNLGQRIIDAAHMAMAIHIAQGLAQPQQRPQGQPAPESNDGTREATGGAGPGDGFKDEASCRLPISRGFVATRSPGLCSSAVAGVHHVIPAIAAV